MQQTRLPLSIDAAVPRRVALFRPASQATTLAAGNAGH